MRPDHEARFAAFPALVGDGDLADLDGERRRPDLPVDEAELERRRQDFLPGPPERG